MSNRIGGKGGLRYFPLSPSMAPTLTSNSFILTPTQHSRLILKNTRLTIFAKQAGPFPSLRFGKSNDSSSSGEPQPDDSANSSPFRFNFGKISVPDVKSLIPVVSNPSSGLSRRKDPGTVFVAGATGQAGVRIAQTLLRQGFSVRAGVPELGSAQELARLAAKYKVGGVSLALSIWVRFVEVLL